MGKFVKFLFAVITKDSPAFALPVAVGDAHHDEEEDKAEEDEPGDDVHDRRRDRDGDRGLHLLSPFQRKVKNKETSGFYVVTISEGEAESKM